MGVSVFGHRGACGYLPENTMPSFELAFELGSDAIEFDVLLTKDSVPVILHDIDLTKTTDVAQHPEMKTTVDQLSYQELSTLRVIERYPDKRIESAKFSGVFEIPTLSELLANPAFDGKHLILERDMKPQSEIEKIVIADKDQLSSSWFKDEILAALGDIAIEWVDPSTNDDQSGIVAVHLSTPNGVVVLD